MASLLRWCRTHPYALSIVLVGAGAGAGLCVHYEIGEGLAVWKRALGGAVAGAWVAIFPLGFRLFD